MERVFIGATRAEATRMADEWWGRQKGLRQTYGPKWLSAERNQMPSSINGP